MNSDKKLKNLMKLGKEMVKHTTLDEAIVTYIDYVKLLVECERCSVFIYNKEDDTVSSIASHGTKGIVAPASKGIVGMTIISKETQFTNDAYNDFRFNKEIDKKTGFLTKHLISVPILNEKDEILGVIQALNSLNKEFSDGDIEFLEFLANYSSLGIENILLKDKLLP